ncbi:transposase [Patescibacteria group bacterium]|nr:transposase [Patescibacteria group bacterium]
MASKPRNILPDNFYHVYNRGAHKNPLFYTDNDYKYFLTKALFYKEKFNIKILAYCILPNHWHFLVQEPRKVTPGVKINHLNSSSSISAFFSSLSNSYTKFFNMNKNHSGRIFQGPFKSKIINDDNYLKILINYINLNHVKHKISDKNTWDYTSYNEYINKSKTKIVDQDYLVDFKLCHKIENLIIDSEFDP